MKRNPIERGDLASVGYENGTLEIEFRDGSVYRYHDVPMETFIALLQADSPGSYLHSHVTMRGNRCEKVGREPSMNQSRTIAPAKNNAIMTAQPSQQIPLTPAERAEIDLFCRVKATNKDGNTPLHWAALDNRLRIAEILVSQGADINARNRNGNTPLHWAKLSDKGHEVAEFLISKGADVKAKNNNGEIPHATPKYRSGACRIKNWEGHDGRYSPQWEDIEDYDGGVYGDHVGSNTGLTVVDDPEVIAKWFPDR